ncbi:MAG TPA: alpha/beta hydrolase [Ktedonosporobacter sp.]|nr:alpha/beta hydrolase [Ktedonosporobacter sp.]
MVTSLPERVIPDWARSISPRRVGIMVLILFLLFTIVSYTLYVALNYPVILLDMPSFAIAFLARGEITILLGFIGLLLCGVLLFVISLALVPYLEEKRRKRVIITGGSSGIGWVVGALLGLTLLPLWASALTNVAQVLAGTFFVLAEVALPLLLMVWTMTLACQFRALGVLGVSGLLLVLLRSLIWGLNALLPIASGFYGTAGVVNILAVAGESLWLFWLLLFGFRLMLERKASVGAAQTQRVRPNARRWLLRSAVGLAVGLTGVAFVGASTALTIINQPPLEGDDVPAEPSFGGTLLYILAWSYTKIYPIRTIADQKRLTAPSAPVPLPPGVTLAKVDAGGVPAERIVAPGASSSRWIFYTHGGGWTQGIQDSHRSLVSKLSQALGASGLLPDYRGIPEHPFPAGLNDCVTAYRWLLSQGVAASQIVIAGESAGGNLALTTALAVRESGGAVPAVLVAISPATDMAMTGETFQSKAFADPILGGGLAQDAFALYTNHGATDPRNPLVSPLYGDMHGMPPTLLQVGTQEVLLSDSTRLADRLKAAGVETKLEVWPGMLHAFTGGFDNFVPESRLATQHVVKFIRQHLGT